MDFDDDTPSRVCTGCGSTAPRTNSDYTLISSRFGWRFRRYMHQDAPVAEWWCPTCWSEFKKGGGGITSTAPPSRPKVS